MNNYSFKFILIFFVINIIACKKDKKSDSKNEIDSIDVFFKEYGELKPIVSIRDEENTFFNYKKLSNNIEVFSNDSLPNYDLYFHKENLNILFKNKYIFSIKYNEFYSGTYDLIYYIKDSTIFNRNINNNITNINKYLYKYDILYNNSEINYCTSQKAFIYNANNVLQNIDINVNDIIDCYTSIFESVKLFSDQKYQYDNLNLSNNESNNMISDMLYCFIFYDVFSAREMIEFQKLIYNKKLKINQNSNFFLKNISSDVIKEISGGILSQEIKLKYIINNNRIEEIDVDYKLPASYKNIIYKIKYK